MRSLQLKAVQQLYLLESPVPNPGPGEVLIKVSHCALCRTDAKMLQQGQRDLVLPRILGHEICGTRVETGERFAVWPGQSCGLCPPCAGGWENLCSRMKIVGFHMDGGFAEYVKISKSSLLKVPESLPDPLACLAEPLACTLNALEQGKVSKDQTILIYGGGPVGLMMAMAAKSLEANPFVVEQNPVKFQRSEKFRRALGIEGALDCHSFHSSTFDVVVNAAPSPGILPEGIGKLKAGGCFCLFSGLTGDTAFPASLLNEIHYRQLHLAGAYGCTRRQMEWALTLLAALPEPAACLIDGIIDLEEIPAALEAILAGNALKFIAKL